MLTDFVTNYSDFYKPIKSAYILYISSTNCTKTMWNINELINY